MPYSITSLINGIKYREDVKIKELNVQRKKCKDCGRKHIVRKMLLDKYYEVEG